MESHTYCYASTSVPFNLACCLLAIYRFVPTPIFAGSKHFLEPHFPGYRMSETLHIIRSAFALFLSPFNEQYAFYVLPDTTRQCKNCVGLHSALYQRSISLQVRFTTQSAQFYTTKLSWEQVGRKRRGSNTSCTCSASGPKCSQQHMRVHSPPEPPDLLCRIEQSPD